MVWTGTPGNGAVGIDGAVTVDVINELTGAAGTTIEGVLLKDSEVTTDTINEKTGAAGVTVDGVVCKDSEVLATNTAKSWGNWTDAGALSASFNISSITDNGVGSHTINWDTDFGSVNYSVNMNGHKAGGGASDANSVWFSVAESQAAATCSVECYDMGMAAQDAGDWFMCAFGAQ